MPISDLSLHTIPAVLIMAKIHYYSQMYYIICTVQLYINGFKARWCLTFCINTYLYCFLLERVLSSSKVQSLSGQNVPFPIFDAPEKNCLLYLHFSHDHHGFTSFAGQVIAGPNTPLCSCNHTRNEREAH